VCQPKINEYDDDDDVFHKSFPSYSLSAFIAFTDIAILNLDRTKWTLAFVFVFLFIFFCFWLRVLDEADDTQLFSPR